MRRRWAVVQYWCDVDGSWLETAVVARYWFNLSAWRHMQRERLPVYVGDGSGGRGYVYAVRWRA